LELATRGYSICIKLKYFQEAIGNKSCSLNSLELTVTVTSGATITLIIIVVKFSGFVPEVRTSTDPPLDLYILLFLRMLRAMHTYLEYAHTKITAMLKQEFDFGVETILCLCVQIKYKAAVQRSRIKVSVTRRRISSS